MITIKVSLILLAGLAVAALLRRRSAAVRHWILAAAIACAAATPLFELVVPSWDVPLSSAASTRGVIPMRTLADAAPPASPHAAPEGRARLLALAAAASGTIWIAGAAISIAVLLAGLARLMWLAAGARRVQDERWMAIADDIARDYGLRRPVALLQSEHPTLLVTWGLLRPRVLVPQAAGDWSSDRIRIVLGHELAHVRRHDWLVQMAAEVLRSVYWFNPLLWIACSRLRRESEHACDDAVLNLGVRGTEYASELVDLARTFSRHRTVLVARAGDGAAVHS